MLHGDLVFGRHGYNIGCDNRPDNSVLQERANLKLTESGQVVGVATYFWDSINEGEVARPPAIVTLSDSYEPSYFLPSGESRFSMPGFSDITGVLALNCLEIKG